MENSKLRNGGIFVMAAILVVGTISTILPASFAQPDYRYAEDPYADPYVMDNKKSSVNIQKIKCINENININGIQITEIPQNGVPTTEAQALDDTTNENGLLGDGVNLDKNLVSICVNVNLNEQADQVPPFDPQNCDDCFSTTNEGGPIPPGLLTMLNNYLAANEVTVGEDTQIVGNVQGLCQLIVQENNEGTPATEQQIRDILNAAFPGNSNPAVIDRVVDCLLGLGLITASPPE